MVQKSTIEPSGPTVTRITFNLNEVKQALIDYAESKNVTVPNGNQKVANLVNKPSGDAAVLEVIEQ